MCPACGRAADASKPPCSVQEAVLNIHGNLGRRSVRLCVLFFSVCCNECLTVSIWGRKTILITPLQFPLCTSSCVAEGAASAAQEDDHGRKLHRWKPCCGSQTLTPELGRSRAALRETLLEQEQLVSLSGCWPGLQLMEARYLH